MTRGNAGCGRRWGMMLSVCAFLFASLAQSEAFPLEGKYQMNGMDRAAVNDRSVLAEAFSACPASRRPDTLTLAFIGDVMLHKAQTDNASGPDGSFDFSMYFKDIKDDLSGADIAVANMEFTLAGKPYTGYPSFSAPDEYAEYMAECGIDVFLTANNHILDKGRKGLARTIDAYRRIGREYGTRMTGSAEDEAMQSMNYPLMMSARGLKIAFVNFTYGTNVLPDGIWPATNYTDREKISEAIMKARRLGAGLIVALPHWGEEYKTRHSRSQEELAEWLAAQGAGLIVGTHPHVVQDTDTIDAGDGRNPVPVIYSLGNAISNMSAKDTQIGLLLKVRVALDPWGGVCCVMPEYTFLWTSLPGRLCGSHCTVKVRTHIGKRGLWTSPYEYDKMTETYRRVRSATGITDRRDGDSEKHTENR